VLPPGTEHHSLTWKLVNVVSRLALWFILKCPIFLHLSYISESNLRIKRMTAAIHPDNIRRKLYISLVSAASFIFASSTLAQEAIIQPSFGITWEDTKEDVISEHPGATERRQGVFDLITISGEASPDLPSNTDSLTYVFHDDFGLVKVNWASDDITNDLFGTAGIALFEQLRESLSKRLGEATMITFTGQVLWNERDEFYQCLNHAGCGAHAAFWSTESESGAMLELKGLSRGTGYILYAVQHPNFEVALEQRSGDDASKF
jgi:hypothetical protein